MATTTESIFFPPLDKCFAGEMNLISWKTAYRALCDQETSAHNTQLEQFLGEQESIDILGQALYPFAKPTQKSERDFETKTAPVNVSQASRSDHDLNELKEDAKWLAKEVQIEELAALRMAIIEWQERPADQLLSIIKTSGGALTGSGDLASSVFAQDAFRYSRTANEVSGLSLDFTKDDVRRRRLLDVYLTEKAYILKLSADLVGHSAVSEGEPSSSSLGSLYRDTQRNWIGDIADKIIKAMRSGNPTTNSEAYCVQCIEALDLVLQRADDKSLWPKVFADNEASEQAYIDGQYSELLTTLRLLLAHLYTFDGLVRPSTVRAWFSVMENHGFVQDSKPSFAAIDVSVTQYLISIISLEILKLPLVVSELLLAAGTEETKLRDSLYLNSDDCVLFLNATLYQCATQYISVASLAIYAWSIITSLVRELAKTQRENRERQVEQVDDETEGPMHLPRRGSRDFQSDIERLFDSLSMGELGEARDDPPRFFATVAIDSMHVFSVISNLSTAGESIFSSHAESATALISRLSLLDAISEGIHFVEYDSEVLDAILSVLMPIGTSQTWERHSSLLASKFLSDDHRLKPAILTQALTRYPYELSPMLRLLRALSYARLPKYNSTGLPQVAQILEDLQTMTQMVPEDFRSYQLDHEDENANTMVLTDALPIFSTKEAFRWISSLSARRALAMTANSSQNENSVMSVSAGSSGVLVRESRPFVLKLEHAHSGLEYLGLLLSTFSTNSELVPALPSGGLDRLTAADVVALFTAVLSATLKQSEDVNDALFILGRLSYSLQNEQDIVTVVADIFETELLAHLDQVTQEGSLELAIVCAEFFSLLVKISPERVWSMLASSSLLGLVGGASSLASVVGSSEVQFGQYRFFKACVYLHANLMDNSIAGLVKRKARGSRATKRFDPATDFMDSTPERAMSTVLNAYQRILLDALQNLADWRFESQHEKCEITIAILKSFSKLLKCTYGIHVADDPSRRLTGVLAPAAEVLLEACAPSNGSSPMLNTFGRMLPNGVVASDDSLPMQIRVLFIEQTKSTLQFLTLLLRSAQFKTSSADGRAQRLAFDLLKGMSTFAALLSSDHAFKYDLFTLLSELVRAIGADGAEPPSILGQLGIEGAKAFLMITTRLDRPLCDLRIERRAWDFLSSIMSTRQQWFALYLLTGTLPKDRLKRQDSGNSVAKPLLSYVLDQLSNISLLPPERAIGMLKFLALAQQSWAWATNQLRSHPDFLNNTLAWLNDVKAPPREPPPASALISAKEYEMAAYLCDIFAILAHANLEIGDRSFLKNLVPKLGFLRDHGAKVDAYNRSLHRNLAENLRAKFPQSELSDFKRTNANPQPFGTEYSYDRQFARDVLCHDVSWHGANRDKNNGFSDEFSRANVNLSLVDAQTRLLKSWKALATTLCECADQDSALQEELAKVAEKCLLASSNPQIDDPGVADLLQLRLELAFIVTSRLVSLRVRTEAMKTLLPAAWELTRASLVNYDVATASQDVCYYRKLLQVLYLAIQPNIYTAGPGRTDRATDPAVLEYLAPNTASCLVDIVGGIITPGFRALCGNLHSNLELALPADFALLTALFQAILSVPGISSVHSIIADVIAGSSTVRSALSLFSWADQLADVMDQDPVYGEIAVVFLLALSGVRPIAEQIALGGVLTQLASANLSNYFRKPGGRGPFDEPQRMFVIWTEGFLPLCLNLLDSVGPPVAAEVANFLNSFQEQLKRAEKALENEIPGPRNPRAGAVTFNLVSEAHHLAMIARIVQSDMARGAAEGINAADVPALGYNVDSVKALVDALTRSKRSLNDRITPVGPTEARWLQTPADGASDNLLMAKIMKEVVSMRACFGESEA